MPTRLILQEQDGAVQVLLHREGQILPEPAGPALPFEVPLDAKEREDLRWYLEDYLLAPYGVYQDRGVAIENSIPVWGERLFNAVFGPGQPGRDAYLKARAEDPCELWIASASPSFLGLPWELLRDPDRPTPLALELAGLNRTLSAAGAAADPRPGERLRVLMVIARPYGKRDVGYRMVARPLLERLAPVAGGSQLCHSRIGSAPPGARHRAARSADSRHSQVSGTGYRNQECRPLSRLRCSSLRSFQR